MIQGYPKSAAFCQGLLTTTRDTRTGIFVRRFWAHFRRFFKAPETGLSAPIFFAGNGKKVFPLQSLARSMRRAFFAHK
jgi:hypothetical protein